MWIKILAHFTSEMAEGAKNKNINIKSWSRFTVARFLARFLPVSIAGILAAPLAAILLTIVRRHICIYKTQGQAKLVQKAVMAEHKDPEVLRQAFANLALIEND